MSSGAVERETDELVRIPDELPILPLRDMVVYPFIIAPLSVARDVSIRAVDQALAENRMILLTAQRDKDEDEPGEDELPRRIRTSRGGSNGCRTGTTTRRRSRRKR
jgi:ATP-dependent Lon protease